MCISPHPSEPSFFISRVIFSSNLRLLKKDLKINQQHCAKFGCDNNKYLLENCNPCKCPSFYLCQDKLCCHYKSYNRNFFSTNPEHTHTLLQNCQAHNRKKKCSVFSLIEKAKVRPDNNKNSIEIILSDLLRQYFLIQ